MLKTVTIRTKNFKIAYVIIFPIPIDMMDAKNFWFRIIATAIALINHISCSHIFSDCRKSPPPSFLVGFSNTFLGTKFSRMRSMTNKFFMAVMTCIGKFSLISFRLIITKSRAIFSLIRSARNMLKFLITNFTISFYGNSDIESSTRARAKFKCKQSIFRDVTRFITV